MTARCWVVLRRGDPGQQQGGCKARPPPKCPHQGKYSESPMPGDVEMQGLEENALKLLSCRHQDNKKKLLS